MPVSGPRFPVRRFPGRRSPGRPAGRLAVTAGPGTPASVLADSLPAGQAAALATVVAGAAVIGLCAQVAFPLPGTPVPFTLQTFAVLMVAAALGPRRGVGAVALYVGAGLAGVPWFAAVATRGTAGYLVGFVVCAVVVGSLARRGLDRRVRTTVVVLAAGDLLVLLAGATGLVLGLGLTPGQAVTAGVTPFLLGEAMKVVLASLLLPAAWRLVGTAPRG